jgi:hypothetical protein
MNALGSHLLDEKLKAIGRSVLRQLGNIGKGAARGTVPQDRAHPVAV